MNLWSLIRIFLIFFCIWLQQNLDKAGDLLEEASQCSSGTSLKDLAKSLKQHLRGFSDRLEETRERLEDTSRCFYLLDKVRDKFGLIINYKYSLESVSWNDEKKEVRKHDSIFNESNIYSNSYRLCISVVNTM